MADADGVQLQLSSRPPILTVAVMVEPAISGVVETVIDGVPWPLVIVPAETVHSYVTLSCEPPLTFAVKVIVSPGTTSLAVPSTVIEGHSQ